MKVPSIMHDVCSTVAIRLETMDVNVPMQIHVTDMVESGNNTLAMICSCISITSGPCKRDSSQALAGWQAGTATQLAPSTIWFDMWLLSAVRLTHAPFVRRTTTPTLRLRVQSSHHATLIAQGLIPTRCATELAIVSVASPEKVVQNVRLVALRISNWAGLTIAMDGVRGHNAHKRLQNAEAIFAMT
jgi:hypothetical protein